MTDKGGDAEAGLIVPPLSADSKRLDGSEPRGRNGEARAAIAESEESLHAAMRRGIGNRVPADRLLRAVRKFPAPVAGWQVVDGLVNSASQHPRSRPGLVADSPRLPGARSRMGGRPRCDLICAERGDCTVLPALHHIFGPRAYLRRSHPADWAIVLGFGAAVIGWIILLGRGISAFHHHWRRPRAGARAGARIPGDLRSLKSAELTSSQDGRWHPAVDAGIFDVGPSRRCRSDPSIRHFRVADMSRSVLCN